MVSVTHAFLVQMTWTRVFGTSRGFLFRCRARSWVIGRDCSMKITSNIAKIWMFAGLKFKHFRHDASNSYFGVQFPASASWPSSLGINISAMKIEFTWILHIFFHSYMSFSGHNFTNMSLICVWNFMAYAKKRWNKMKSFTSSYFHRALKFRRQHRPASCGRSETCLLSTAHTCPTFREVDSKHGSQLTFSCTDYAT